jgi:hypothetical protein
MKEDEMDGHVAHTREMRNVYKIVIKILKERDHCEDIKVDGGWY